MNMSDRQAGNPALVIDTGAVIEQNRGTLRIPAMLVASHPLQSYRPAELLCDQRRFGRAIVGTIAAVAPGALDINAAHALWRQLQHGGQLRTQKEACL